MEESVDWGSQAIMSLVLIWPIIIILLKSLPGVVAVILQVSWISTVPLVALLNVIGKTPLKYLLGG